MELTLRGMLGSRCVFTGLCWARRVRKQTKLPQKILFQYVRKYLFLDSFLRKRSANRISKGRVFALAQIVFSEAT